MPTYPHLAMHSGHPPSRGKDSPLHEEAEAEGGGCDAQDEYVPDTHGGGGVGAGVGTVGPALPRMYRSHVPDCARRDTHPARFSHTPDPPSHQLKPAQPAVAAQHASAAAIECPPCNDLAHAGWG